MSRIRISQIKLIGLTGTNGAGKGEVAAFFKGLGYAYISLSDILRDELKKRGLEISRDNLIACGNELREKYGPDILARRAAEKIAGPTVIDSIRNSKEVEYLRSLGQFILIAVDAPVEIRFERVKKRGRNESASTLEEFRQKEELERRGQLNGQQLEACMSLADITIINDSTVEDLRHKLEALE
ncbi:MAG: AAA family ATPase [Candidatus Aminicenantes bacterium]|jgi:Dephospho-CoA kinase|nr:AAA family ATPase [Candidatus Aminicenantes bacterium]